MRKDLEERAYEVLGAPETITYNEKISRDEIKAMLVLGYGVSAISRYYGVSRGTIYSILGSAKALAVEMLGTYEKMKQNRARLSKRAAKDWKARVESGEVAREHAAREQPSPQRKHEGGHGDWLGSTMDTMFEDLGPKGRKMLPD